MPARVGPAPPVSPLAVGLAWLAGYVLLLAFVPRHVPVAPDVASASALAGYHTGAAYFAVAAWTALGVLACALLARSGRLPAPPPEPDPGTGETARPRAALELGLLFAVFALAYFPPFLARYGPYSEDHIYLSMLHRMAAGQRPYVDFEFLYGPLLILPVHAWVQTVGFSMKAYYALTALMEGAQATLLMGVLRRTLPRPRERWLAFLLLQPFLLNTLLGVNWNGLRRLVPVFVLLLLARRPTQPAVVAGAGALLGLQLAYSHDYGVACLAAALAVFGFEVLQGRLRALPAALAFVAVSGAVGVGVAALLLGPDLATWIALARELVARYDAGEAGFAFRWTLNSLAAFALLTVAGLGVARGLFPRSPRPASAGDRLLLAGLAYAFVTLKSGLNRSDFWHLDAAFLPLAVAVLLPLPRAAFALEPGARKLARAALALVAATALIGILPIGSHVARGWLAGAVDVVTGRPAGVEDPPRLRAASLALENTHPDAASLELGAWLAEDARAARPVVFYGLAWSMGKQVGVPKSDFLNDEFIYSDERALGLRRFLEERPAALVVMHRFQYERLFGLSPPDRFPELDFMVRPTPLKRIARWTTSVHYDGVPLEVRARDARLARSAGALLVERFAETARFGDWVVLERAGSAGSLPRGE